MITILGISGSLRAQSFNTALLRAAQVAVAGRVQLDIATLHGIPLYDGDEEQAHGVPEAVLALRARALAADGVLLATPEYNNGIPASSRMRWTGCRARSRASRNCSATGPWP